MVCDVQETRLLQRLSGHPYIVTVNCTFMEKRDIFMEMPFYAGGTLATWMRDDAPSPEACRCVLRQLLLALERVHALKIVHCDIKPDNIFLETCDPPHIRLGDFDVSLDNKTRTSFAATQAQTGLLHGGGLTPLYAAPELLQSPPLPASAASDVYALGLICYQLFCPGVTWRPGQPPAPEAIAAAARRDAKHQGSGGDNDDANATGNGEELASLLRTWLHPDPAQRPTPADLLAHPFLANTALQLELQVQTHSAEARRRLGPERTCCICLDEVFSSQGVDCGDPAAEDGPVDAKRERHFVCGECFDAHVQDQATQELGRINARHGEITCPHATPQLQCLSRPYPRQVVAKYASPAALQAYLQALTQLQERRLAAEFKEQQQAAIRDELARLARMTALEKEVDAARQHVENDLLTLKCPHPGCQQAFVDFSDCFALTCSRCRGCFCAWCLSACSSWETAHTHVAGCQANRAPNRAVFGTPALFELAQRERRTRAVSAFLASLTPAVRTALLPKLRPTLGRLGINGSRV